jgi:hypothetical protein
MMGSRRSVAGGLLLASIAVISCGDSSENRAAARVPDDRGDAGSDVPASTDGADFPDTSAEDAPETTVDGPDSSDDDAADASPDDAPTVDVVDAEAPEVFPDAPVSRFCGDSIRDPVTEECDDGPGSDDDSCTPGCRVRSPPIVSTKTDGEREPGRSLGAGRHVASAGDSSFGVVYTQADPSPTVRLQVFDSWGRRDGDSVNVGTGAQPTGAANPVVAALPGGRFAVAWTDATSGTPDVALRLVSSGSAPSGAPALAHVLTSGPQQDPDILWTGNELIAAWSDLFSVKYRRFTEALAPASGESTLSGGTQFAGNVALTAFAGSWAGAWRAGDQGLETVAVRNGDSTWTTRPFSPALEGDHPALVELDATHLLLFFTSGGEISDASQATGRRLRFAIVDTAAPGTVEASMFLPTTPPYDRDETLRQRRPAAARVNDRLFVAWETESALGDPLLSEFFVAEIGWSAGEPHVIRSIAEWPAPADAFRSGDQKGPALAASRLFPGGALITVWEDHSRLLTGRPSPELMLNFRPVPFVLLADGRP